MNEIIARIEALARTRPERRTDFHFGPVPVADVEHTERVLGVRLPNSYRSYLIGFGGGLLLGYEFRGIPTERSAERPGGYDIGNSIIDITAENRWRRKYVPDGWIFITDDGGDYSFYLDTSRMSDDGECPVVVAGPGRDGPEVAATFFSFLERMARGENIVYDAPAGPRR